MLRSNYLSRGYIFHLCLTELSDQGFLHPKLSFLFLSRRRYDTAFPLEHLYLTRLRSRCLMKDCTCPHYSWANSLPRLSSPFPSIRLCAGILQSEQRSCLLNSNYLHQDHIFHPFEGLKYRFPLPRQSFLK